MEDGFVAGLDPISLAGDAENLSDGRVVDQTGKGVQHLNPALFDAAMSFLVVFAEAGSRGPVPVDGLQGLEGFRCVALDCEQVVCAMVAPNGESGRSVWRATRLPEADFDR